MLAVPTPWIRLISGRMLDGRVVVQEVLVDVFVFAIDVDIHQHAGHVLHDDDAFAFDDRRELFLTA